MKIYLEPLLTRYINITDDIIYALTHSEGATMAITKEKYHILASRLLAQLEVLKGELEKM